MLLAEKQQINEIYRHLSDALDITESQYEIAEKRYKALGEFLQEENSRLALYEPEVYPQGSFRLGTVIRPLGREDEFDLDLVCKLNDPPKTITQRQLKNMVGERLKEREYYRKILGDEGNRCWTLQYSDETRFHMDVLPSIADPYTAVLESVVEKDVLEHAIRITDRRDKSFDSSNVYNWLKSNPIGYAEWFKNRMKVMFEERLQMLAESRQMEIEDIPFWQVKTPLQRAIQIMKRHRDIMFGDDEDKPISIIITTLAAKSYDQEDNIYDALIKLLNTMPDHITYKYEDGKRFTWVENPVNPNENFADKWLLNPNREKNFHEWIDKASQEIPGVFKVKGLHNINESMEPIFGKRPVTEAFNKMGENLKSKRDSGTLKMAGGTGILGEVGRTVVKKHNFFGKDE